MEDAWGRTAKPETQAREIVSKEMSKASNAEVPLCKAPGNPETDIREQKNKNKRRV